MPRQVAAVFVEFSSCIKPLTFRVIDQSTRNENQMNPEKYHGDFALELPSLDFTQPRFDGLVHQTREINYHYKETTKKLQTTYNNQNEQKKSNGQQLK